MSVKQFRVDKKASLMIGSRERKRSAVIVINE